MNAVTLLADAAAPGFEQLMNLGAAGLMGAMWLWERRTSRQREQQLDEAHTRILSDRVQLGELMDVVRQNTAAITRLTNLSLCTPPRLRREPEVES